MGEFLSTKDSKKRQELREIARENNARRQQLEEGQNRIINGIPAGISPWVAAFFIKPDPLGDFKDEQFFCSGSIINPRFIM